mgnify:FL=1|tara:strand:- start:370 stop:828 length:459 start_codon:yes stop_codon:yes gene_type:complete
MTHVYDILEIIKDELLASPSVNTVTYGDLSEVDLDKTTIFPLSHMLIDSANYKERTVVFNINLLCADIVDYNTKKANHELFYSNDNLQDVMNTQFQVINSLIMKLMRGDLFEMNYQVTTQPTAEPFKERFGNELAGWGVNISIEVPNGISIC